MRCYLFISLAPFLTFGTFATCQAQALPDAGSLRQQIEQLRMLPSLPSSPGAPRQDATVEQPKPGALKVKVQTIRFVGNTVLSNEELEKAVETFADRELSFDELRRAADAVAAAYRAAGWLVRVDLPEQDISTGLLTMRIIEARFGGLRLEGAAPTRILPSDLEAYFRFRQQDGQPLNIAALDRALLLADDLPGVSVAGTLVPGPNDGETTLAIQTTDEPLVYGDVGLDNHGARATGSERLTANLNINSPGQRGELLSFNLLHSRGSDYARAALTLPYGYSGLRLGVNASTMTYRVLDGVAKGNSDSLGLDMSQPLLRSRATNVFVSGGLDIKTYFTKDTEVKSHYASQALRVGLAGNHFDQVGGGGANSGSLQLVQGQLVSIKAHNLIDSIPRSFRKVSYGLSRQQSLTANQSLFIGLSGQQATQSLDTSEKFYIGGAQSVRAYPASELSGDRGQTLTGEWRWRVAPAWVLTAFADVGRVVTLPTGTEPSSPMQLQGRGLSLAWQGLDGLSARLTWSRRIGANPKPYNGTDGDGSLTVNRLWLSTSLSF